MGKFLLAVVFTSVLALVVTEWPCDDYHDGQVHYVGHEYNCSLFYECRDGLRTVLACPSGLWYSLQLDACVYPSQSECESISTFCNGAESDYYPDPYDCTKYVECYQGSSYELTCPGGLYFNAATKQCANPSQSGCDYSQFTTPKPNCDGVSVGHIMLKPYDGNCNYYWRCIGGEGQLEKCGADMYFDEVKQVCDFSALVECKQQSSSDPTTSSPVVQPTTQPSSDPRCANHSQTSYWAHPADCTKYIECYNGNGYEISCPTGMYFNESLSSCVDAHNFTCGVAPTSPTTVPTVPTDWVQVEECHYNGQRLPYPADCSKYYECYYGFKFPIDCATGLYFHQATGECDYRYISDCR